VDWIQLAIIALLPENVHMLVIQRQIIQCVNKLENKPRGLSDWRNEIEIVLRIVELCFRLYGLQLTV